MFFAGFAFASVTHHAPFSLSDSQSPFVYRFPCYAPKACEAVYQKADGAFAEVMEGGDELLADFEGDDEQMWWA